MTRPIMVSFGILDEQRKQPAFVAFLFHPDDARGSPVLVWCVQQPALVQYTKSLCLCSCFLRWHHVVAGGQLTRCGQSASCGQCAPFWVFCSECLTLITDCAGREPSPVFIIRICYLSLWSCFALPVISKCHISRSPRSPVRENSVLFVEWSWTHLWLAFYRVCFTVRLSLFPMGMSTAFWIFHSWYLWKLVGMFHVGKPGKGWTKFLLKIWNMCLTIQKEKPVWTKKVENKQQFENLFFIKKLQITKTE